jgi:hypothetical protein
VEWVITRKGLAVSNGGKFVGEGHARVEIVDVTQSPIHLDVVSGLQSSGPHRRSKLVYCIIDDDVLRIVYNLDSGGERPKSVETPTRTKKTDPDYFAFEFVRVKEKK